VSRRIIAVYAALMTAFGVVMFATPTWNVPTWALIGALSTAAIAFGTWWHAPPRRAAWWLLGGAVLAMTLGDAIFGASITGAGDTAPAIADVLYFAMFPLLTAGLLMLTRAGGVLRDRSRLLDLLAFGCSAALAAWAFLIGPTLGSALSTDEKSTLAAYTIGDLLILVVATRLLIATRRNWATVLLAIGAFGALVSDISYALSQVRTGWVPGGPGELGYLLFYACWGAAALHPSMVELSTPVAPQPSLPRTARLRGGWTVLLGLSLAIPPATLLAEALTGGVRDGVVIAAASVVTFALVITRLADALREHRRAVDRERELREVCGTLVAATDPAAVIVAMRTAVSALMTPDVDHLFVFRGTDRYPLPPEPVRRRTRIVPTHLLRTDLRAELDAFDTALVCPLAPGAGVVLVAAAEDALVAAQDAVEVLAAQAAQALDRIALTEVATRRDSDEYLRAVVRHTTDVVLVIDDDQRIRYASPSLRTVLGVEPPAFATLRDIVDPDDHDQVMRTLFLGEDSRDVWNLQRPDRSRVLVEVSYRDLREDRLVRGFVITLRDITAERAAQQESVRRAIESSPAGQNRRSVSKKFTPP
jgi:PAS domain S-box-containing protein